MDLPPEITKAAPGIVGSFIAMWRLSGLHWWQRIVSFIGGIACAHWLTDVVVKSFPVMSQNATSFVLGLFGMSLIGQGFQAVDSLDLTKVLPKKFQRTKT